MDPAKRVQAREVTTVWNVQTTTTERATGVQVGTGVNTSGAGVCTGMKTSVHTDVTWCIDRLRRCKIIWSVQKLLQGKQEVYMCE